MSTHKRIDIICIAAIAFTVVLTGLLMNGTALGITAAISTGTDNPFFTADDLDADWDTSSATRIVLSDKGSAISGHGAYANGEDVYIAYAGYYILTGELTNGSIIIDADKNDKIWVLLDGVTLHCEDSAAIRIEQAAHVFLTLADGTENTISSGGQYDSGIVDLGVDGTIYSRDNLTINGTGALAVNAEYQHGIVCNDDLMITGGDLTICAVQDGIHANDSVRIREAGITVSAGDDGITVSNDDETAFLYVESGRITIPDCYEGLEAVDIMIAGGTIDITAMDDGINASGSGSSSVIRIAGGDITVQNPSGRDVDGLDSNGSIYIEGGNVFISVSDGGSNCALDYGSENGGECIVSGGTVIACGGSGMAEGFDADSTQNFLMYNKAATAGTAISLTDSEGRELLSQEIPCSFSSIILSTPELKLGDVCTIAVGEEQEQVTIDNSTISGLSPVGMFGGGMQHGKNHPLDDMEAPGRMEPPEGMPENGMAEMPKERPEDGMADMPKERPEDRMADMPTDQLGNMPKHENGMEQPEIENVVLVGISLLVLFIGVLVARKIKYRY